MENPSTEQFGLEKSWEVDAPGLSGLVARMRLVVGEDGVGVLEVDNGHATLGPDRGAVDVTLHCATRDILVRALKGQLNPVVAALRNEAGFRGNREFGIKIIYGLREGAPFANVPFDRKES
jgi:hypothetical protein